MSELSRGWMVMVIDDAALRVVSALVGMYDVMEHRVTLIELLKKDRQPLPVRTRRSRTRPSTCPLSLSLSHSLTHEAGRQA